MRVPRPPCHDATQPARFPKPAAQPRALTNRHAACPAPRVLHVRPHLHPDASGGNGAAPGSGAAGNGAAAGDGAAPEGIPACAPAPNRLNLLLSYAGWRHESWVDRLPRLLEPMGVCSLRADTGAAASKVIARYPIHVAVVDLGLPLEDPSTPDRIEEAGPRLLDLLRHLQQPPPTVVVKRGRSEREDCREINAALRAGAFAVIDRPDTQSDLERLLDVLRRCLVRYYHGRWPGAAL